MNNIDTLTLSNHLAPLGATLEVRTTGHSDWIRGFIKLGNLSLGRASFHRGLLSNIKWYGGGSRNYFSTRLCFFMEYGSIIPLDVIEDELYPIAMQKAVAIVDAKKAWRQANPKYNANGSPERRRPLAPPNPARFMNELIKEWYERHQL